MKYVILTSEQHGVVRIYPLIFQEYMTHSTMAAGAIFAMDREEKIRATVLTAGHCYVDAVGYWECIHGSESLHLKKDASRNNDDEKFLNYLDCFQGIIP